MQTIVHVVEGLLRGGSETMLADLLPALSRHYNVVLVSLRPENIFGDEIVQNCHAYYPLEYKGYQSFFSSVKNIKKIIREHKPVLVRSQQTLSTIVARMACPKDIPFVFSIHSTLSLQIKSNLKGRVVKLLERNTVRKSDTLIGVSEVIIDDYKKKFPFQGKSVVLNNYVRDEFFAGQDAEKYSGGTLRLVAIGNLRRPKNYSYLIEAFKIFRYSDVQLDIYGDGPLLEQIREQIKSADVNIHLKGSTSRSFDVLKNYHAFVMVSSYEGFGIAVAEAMASGLPVILSDIAVFREITGDNAFFVDISSIDSFVTLINMVLKGNKSLDIHTAINKKFASEMYSKNVYIANLLKIYQNALSGFEAGNNNK